MFKKAATAVLKSTDDIPFAIIILSTIAVVMLALNFAFAIAYLRWSRARA